jgi:hypothetical protein
LLGVVHCAAGATMTSSSMLVPLLCTILACTCCLLVASEPESLHLSYYIQEIRYGPNRTLLAAAGTGQGNVAEIGWGSFLVFEQALKAGPTADSKLLGTITGTATITTKGGFATGGLKLSAEHIFNEASEYNGSSLTLTAAPATSEDTGAMRLGKTIEETTVPPLYVWKWDIYLSKCTCSSETGLSY